MGRMTEQEKSAVDAWLNKNKPVRYPTGYSSIYDEFGNKRVTLKFRMAGLAKRVRAALKKDPNLTYDGLSKALLLSRDDVVAVCRKHQIEVSE